MNEKRFYDQGWDARVQGEEFDFTAHREWRDGWSDCEETPEVGRQLFQGGSMKFCPCGDRPRKDCPGEWESGCNLGANEMYVGVIRKTNSQRNKHAWKTIRS